MRKTSNKVWRHIKTGEFFTEAKVGRRIALVSKSKSQMRTFDSEKEIELSGFEREKRDHDDKQTIFGYQSKAQG